MKITRVFLTVFMILFSLGAGLAAADCGSGHGKKNPHHMGKISSATFDQMDKDGSGGITYDEFKALFPNTKEVGFAALDRDGDKTLSQQEWQAFKDAHKGMGKYKTYHEKT
jgi:hypothetical protein